LIFSSRTEPIWAPSPLFVCSHTPTVHSTTISRFLCNCFPRMAPQFFGHHDSPSNLAKSRYPPRMDVLLQFILTWSGYAWLHKVTVDWRYYGNWISLLVCTGVCSKCTYVMWLTNEWLMWCDSRMSGLCDVTHEWVAYVMWLTNVWLVWCDSRMSGLCDVTHKCVSSMMWLMNVKWLGLTLLWKLNFVDIE